MTEEKKKLIVRIERGETEDHKPVIELYEDNPRLKYPALRLFEPSMLFDIGLDPNELQVGEERFVRFDAYYVESERLNGQGNPYLDVTRLIALDGPQNDALQDTLDRILEVLVSVEHHLAQMANPVYTVDPSGEVHAVAPRHGPAPQQPQSQPAQPKAEAPPWEDSNPQPKQQPEERGPVLDEDMARKRFAKLAGPATRDGSIAFAVPGQLTSQISAGAINWRDALQQLEAAIAKGQSS